MIIPGNALLALLSPPQEIQGTREESGFGALLTEIEQHTASLPDQEEAERRALEERVASLDEHIPVVHTSQSLAGGLRARDRGVWLSEYAPCRGTSARATSWSWYRTSAVGNRRGQSAIWYGIGRSTRHWTTRFPCAGWSGHWALSCGSRSAGAFLLASSSAGEYAGLEWIFHGPANGCIVRLHTDS